MIEPMKKQVFNPYLPSFEYVPDGEPHIFGDRIYLYGSHDRFDGAEFCLNDYICWSAPLSDLSDWRYEGVIYRKRQDPRNQHIPADAPIPQGWRGCPVHHAGCVNAPGVHAMWAPDVAKGPDGRYYLYYCLDVLPETGVAVSDKPQGPYEFYGFVRDQAGRPLGSRPGDVPCFDPGIFVDDDGEIYLYSGNAPRHLADRSENTDTRRHSQVMRLQKDMLTLKTEPRDLIPDINESAGSDYDGHEFFEASSIRKIGKQYYFVYSSVQSHELCYAVSDKADGEYRFGGTLVDIGDVFLNGRTEAESLNAFGNTHGGMECVNGQWYIFYHRQTNQTMLSRQACAEKITVLPDGSIRQAEVTSCGMNDGPLKGEGAYPARIACCVTRYGRNIESMPSEHVHEYPYFTQDVPDFEPTDDYQALDEKIPFQYIANIRDGARIGYKYFQVGEGKKLTLEVRGHFTGEVTLDDGHKKLNTTSFAVDSDAWRQVEIDASFVPGVIALYFCFAGEGKFDFRRFAF